jgi:hypothetical protein
MSEKSYPPAASAAHLGRSNARYTEDMPSAQAGVTAVKHQVDVIEVTIARSP